jgi:polyphosphate kinase 2 (PPK2 family)
VLVVKVHSELQERQKLPPGKRGKAFWQERYDDINHFERHLTRNGTIILKFFLHISKNEQKKRFLERLEDPEKHWKFSTSDLAERGFWKDYMEAFEEALSATSTEWAPWYVILYAAFDKTFFFDVLKTVCCSPIMGRSWNVWKRKVNS